MSFQAMKDRVIGATRQISGFLKSEDKKVSLYEDINKGKLGEEFLNSQFWLKILEPWIEDSIAEARKALENHNSPQRHKGDVQGFYSTGEIHRLTRLKIFIKEEIVQQAIKARQKLGLLEKEEKEQDNAPGKFER